MTSYVLRLAILCCLVAPHVAEARTLYVDNRNGSDASDGLFQQSRSEWSGPVRSIRRVLQLARSGDTIELAKNADPYYETISLMGVRHSGSANSPFVIEGHGATISGLRALPPAGWQPVYGDSRLWRLSFTRKGYYVLQHEGQLVPEFRPGDAADPVADLPVGQWLSWRGGFYYRAETAEPPAKETFAHAGGEVGISLYRTQHVWIRNLVVEHFRVDGLHAHDQCRDIVIENVEFRENGRAGLAVTGTSEVELSNVRSHSNGRYSAFHIAPAELYVSESELDVEPVVRQSQDLD